MSEQGVALLQAELQAMATGWSETAENLFTGGGPDPEMFRLEQTEASQCDNEIQTHLT